MVRRYDPQIVLWPGHGHIKEIEVVYIVEIQFPAVSPCKEGIARLGRERHPVSSASDRLRKRLSLGKAPGVFGPEKRHGLGKGEDDKGKLEPLGLMGRNKAD